MSDVMPEGVRWRAAWRHLRGIGWCAEGEQKHGGGPYPSGVAGCGRFERRNGPVAPVVQRRSSSVQCSKWARSVPVQTRFKLLAGEPGPTLRNFFSLLPKAEGATVHISCGGLRHPPGDKMACATVAITPAAPVFAASAAGTSHAGSVGLSLVAGSMGRVFRDAV